ncbi:hypothetical protein [Paraburkholderia sp. BL17N1]|uniref:hypothetical protein n=1 Tax=Paraburkholderia sp. BL17N1 TaxID=1938798 RepID=UPI0011C3F084|nr:hypothetical protein [Paraburkholderia sp. BL17N1]
MEAIDEDILRNAKAPLSSRAFVCYRATVTRWFVLRAQFGVVRIDHLAAAHAVEGDLRAPHERRRCPDVL